MHDTVCITLDDIIAKMFLACQPGSAESYLGCMLGALLLPHLWHTVRTYYAGDHDW
jgi:hypothetical protein